MNKRPRPLEKEILAQCRDYLRITGWKVWRINMGAFLGEYKGKSRLVQFTDTPGISDLHAIRNGIYLAVEVKRPGRKLTLDQEIFLRDVQLHGGNGLCVSSLEELQRELELNQL